MKIEKVYKDSFVVIGKEGSTRDGDGFVQRLWQEANSNFDEISDLAKRDESGNLVGVWGAMTDFSRSFKPWDDFKRGLYLAGAECRDDADPPEGWIKWVVPGRKYLVTEVDLDSYEETFRNVIDGLIPELGMKLAGAACDFTEPATGQNKLFFPVE